LGKKWPTERGGGRCEYRDPLLVIKPVSTGTGPVGTKTVRFHFGVRWLDAALAVPFFLSAPPTAIVQHPKLTRKESGVKPPHSKATRLSRWDVLRRTKAGSRTLALTDLAEKFARRCAAKNSELSNQNPGFRRQNPEHGIQHPGRVTGRNENPRRGARTSDRTWRETQRTASASSHQDPPRSTRASSPSTGIVRLSLVRIAPFRQAPFPDIAGHVLAAVGTGAVRIAAHLGRGSDVLLEVAPPLVRRIVPPRPSAPVGAPRGFLPLALGGQSQSGPFAVLPSRRAT
jgi:hypothetical protein